MSSRINTARQTANHSQPRVSKLIGELLGRFRAVMRGASRTDNADGVMIGIEEFAPDVEHNRRRMNLAERSGIRRPLLRYNRRTSIADPLMLGRKINRGFPTVAF